MEVAEREREREWRWRRDRERERVMFHSELASNTKAALRPAEVTLILINRS